METTARGKSSGKALMARRTSVWASGCCDGKRALMTIAVLTLLALAFAFTIEVGWIIRC
jgi:hypothetical protein